MRAKCENNVQTRCVKTAAICTVRYGSNRIHDFRARHKLQSDSLQSAYNRALQACAILYIRPFIVCLVRDITPNLGPQ